MGCEGIDLVVVLCTNTRLLRVSDGITVSHTPLQSLYYGKPLPTDERRTLYSLEVTEEEERKLWALHALDNMDYRTPSQPSPDWLLAVSAPSSGTASVLLLVISRGWN